MDTIYLFYVLLQIIFFKKLTARATDHFHVESIRFHVLCFCVKIVYRFCSAIKWSCKSEQRFCKFHLSELVSG